MHKDQKNLLPTSQSCLNINSANSHSELKCITPQHQRTWTKNKIDYNELKLYDLQEKEFFTRKKNLSKNESPRGNLNQNNGFEGM